MNHRPQKSLDQLLEQLPKEVQPPGALWPRIAARLRAQHRNPPLALAAGILLAAACLVSLITWGVLQRPSVPPVIQSAGGRPSFEELKDPKYVLARDMQKKTFEERLALLDPATRTKIETSLAVIRQAHEDIRKALAADPQSPVLEELWQSTWHDELDLYDHIVQATQPTMTRI
jgi:hypothetical protein